MSALERILFSPVAAARPYLALKGTLLLLALDLWLTRASHAGRYGAGGFNVAHFEWLDRMLPAVSPALYVGVCVFTGLACFAIALTPRPPRSLIALTCALHTASWAMSMLDSYQHHYLLSLVLFALIFVPGVRSEEVLRAPALPGEDVEAPSEASEPVAPKSRGKRRRGSKKKSAAKAARSSARRGLIDYLRAPPTYVASWAWTLLAWSTAVVYLYTAFSKSDPEWLSGAALQRVLHLPPGGEVPEGGLDPIGPARMMLGWLGFEGEALWRAMGRSVVLVQIVCAAGYVLAPFRDVLRHWLADVLFTVSLLTALSFHLGAEYMGLQIGWFSWYMVAYALLFMLPSSVLVGALRLLLPGPKDSASSELLLARAGLFLWLGLVAATSETWTQWTVLGVSLEGIFGEGFNVPIALLFGGLVATLPVVMLLRLEPDKRGGLRTLTNAALVLGASLCVVAGVKLDLPGALPAGVAMGVALGAVTIAQLLFGGDARRALGAGIGALLGAAALWSGVTLSEVRWDYYRNVGGDYRRRGELSEAYIAYVKATRYAPEGQTRQDRADQVRAQLEAAGEPVPGITP